MYVQTPVRVKGLSALQVPYDHSASSASSSQTIEYESILGAEVTVEACQSAGGFDWVREFDNLMVYTLLQGSTCTVHYSNAMNTAEGKSPSVTVRDGFLIANNLGLVMTLHPDDLDWSIDSGPTRGFYPWYVQGVYPEDIELRESFRLFAEGGELRDDYAAANCANQRTPDCAQLIMDNLDDWAVLVRDQQLTDVGEGRLTPLAGRTRSGRSGRSLDRLHNAHSA
ncbi:MAG: hypothetical protein ACFCU2_03660 [Acidimicrobiia bacterium]